MTVFALLIAFYSALSLGVFFGKTNREVFFPIFITFCAVVLVVTAFRLWRGHDAYLLTAISTFLVAGITGWLILPFDAPLSPMFVIVLVSFLFSLALLVGLIAQNVRHTLRG